MFKCLDLSVEDLMKIKNIKALEQENEILKERLELCEKALIESNKAILSLRQNVSQLNADFNNFLQDDIMQSEETRDN